MKVTAQLLISGTGSIKEIRATPGNDKDLFIVLDTYNNAAAIDAVVAYLGLEALANTRNIGFQEYLIGLEGMAKDMLGHPLEAKNEPPAQPVAPVTADTQHYTEQLPLFPDKKEDSNVPSISK
jgi:hypothetical protein